MIHSYIINKIINVKASLFQCPYTSQIWKKLTQGILKGHYNMDWDGLTSTKFWSTLYGGKGIVVDMERTHHQR